MSIGYYDKIVIRILLVAKMITFIWFISIYINSEGQSKEDKSDSIRG